MMRKIKLWVIAVMALFLFLSLGFAQQLSDWERQIFYEASWITLEAEYQIATDSTGASEIEDKMQQFISQNNLTQRQFKDIIDRGTQMPFDSVEKELARDINTQITVDLEPDETMARLKRLANQYGMGMGRASSVLIRIMAQK